MGIIMSYYVYIHRKVTDGSVFYIGKGCGRRAWSMHNRTNLWKSTVAKYGRTVEIVLDNLQEWYALEFEQSLILGYGRRDNGTGILVNHTDGGLGIRNFKHTGEFRKTVSQRIKGLKNPKADNKVYTFINIHSREIVDATRYELELKIGCKINDLFKSKVNNVNGWSLLSTYRDFTNSKYDLKYYSFSNSLTGEIFNGTRSSFKKHSGVCPKPLFTKKPYKQTKGWSLVNPLLAN